MDYSALLGFATPRQAEVIEAVIQHGSNHKAARELKVRRSYVQEVIQRVSKKAALQGYSPKHDLHHPVPDGFKLKGASTYYDKDGRPIAQWVKSCIDTERQIEIIKEVIASLKEEIPEYKAKSVPIDYQSDVIPWIQIGDAHIGMLAHLPEIGENFDTKIAEQELCASIGMLIEDLPKSERLVINDLGDFTHYENFAGETEASGHKLDYDGRFPKMIRVAVRIMRFIIESALTKAKHVDVIINQGNHSRTNDIWMGELIRGMYESTGRVHVLNNDSVFIAYRMGNTLVMTHHSDKCKPNMLANVMTTDFREDYGQTQFHYIDIGHVHHGMVMKEHPGIVIESFNHLAALDKWAHDSGYRNRKSITVILRSKTYGEVGRRLLPIEQVRDSLSAALIAVPQKRAVYTV